MRIITKWTVEELKQEEIVISSEFRNCLLSLIVLISLFINRFSRLFKSILFIGLHIDHWFRRTATLLLCNLIGARVFVYQSILRVTHFLFGWLSCFHFLQYFLSVANTWSLLFQFFYSVSFNPSSYLLVCFALTELTCPSDKVYVKFIKQCYNFASEESFEIWDGNDLLYKSPTFVDKALRTIEYCLNVTEHSQYTLKIKDSFGDSWSNGA